MPSRGPGHSGQLCRGSDEKRPGEGGPGLGGPHGKNWLSQAHQVPAAS